MKNEKIFGFLSKWIFVACGTWLIGLGIFFMFARPSLLPEDLRYLGISGNQVEVILPNLVSWLQRVFTVMGGFIAGCGVLTTLVGIRLVPRSTHGTGSSLGCVGLLTVVAMSWTNFMLDSDFRWLLVLPVIAWSLGLISYGVGIKAKRTTASAPKIDKAMY
jgi:predicted membrane channel-forming protein YqfA (hemolysin III family)